MSKWKASNWNNISSEAIKQYWQRSVFLLFLKVAFCEMEARFSQKKRSLKDHPHPKSLLWSMMKIK